MISVAALRQVLARFLQAVVLVLMTGLAALVVLAVGFRKAGASLVWYDEVASVLLAWLTYYGAALAALDRAHIGFPALVRGLPLPLYRTALVAREALVSAFLVLLAWAGLEVHAVLGRTALVSLPWVSAAVAHSVIPIGAVLFLLAELLSCAGAWRGPRPAEEVR